MTDKKPGRGASSLPERTWLSKVLKAHMTRYLGLRLSSVQVWYGLSETQQKTITFAYGEGKGIQAVHKTLMNLKYFNEELTRVEGHGHSSVWVWQERKKPNIVHTTTTPPKERPGIQEQLDTIDEARKKDRDEFKDYRIPATPIDKTLPEPKPEPDYIHWSKAAVAAEPDNEPDVGTVRTFTCIGRFLDDSLVWREDDTGHIGAVGFDAL